MIFFSFFVLRSTVVQHPTHQHGLVGKAISEKRPVEVLDSILAESAEHLADLKHQKELAAGTHLGGWTLTRIVAVECVEEDRRPLLCFLLCILEVNV